MKKIITLFSFILTLQVFAGNNLYQLNVTVKGTSAPEAKLYLYNGLDKTQVSTAKPAKNDTYTFSLNDSSAIGFYLFTIDSVHQFDFVFNKEQIEIKTQFNHFFDSLIIVKSNENKFYQQYFIKQQLLYKHNQLLSIINADLMDQPASQSLIIQLSEKLAGAFEDSIIKLADKSNTWFAGYVKTIIRTGTAKNLLSKRKLSPSELNLLRDIYFEKIDFSNESIVHSRILHDHYFYFLNYLTPNNNTDLIQSIELILTKASANEKVFNYTKTWLTNIFKNSGKDDISAYVNLAKRKVVEKK